MLKGFLETVLHLPCSEYSYLQSPVRLLGAVSNQASYHRGSIFNFQLFSLRRWLVRIKLFLTNHC